MRSLLPALLALSCASAPPPKRSDIMMQVSREYPNSAYIVGTGSGKSPEEAEQRAKVQCAAGVSSTIEATLKTSDSERRRNDVRTTDSSVKRDLEEKIKSDSAALIRVLPELTTLTDAGWVAVAVLSRTEMESKYKSETDTTVSRLEALWKRVLADPKAASVGAALCEIQKLEPEIDEKRVERTVTTRGEALTEDQKRLRADVRKIYESYRKSTFVVVGRPAAVEGVPLVADEVLSELTKRGVTARMSDVATCDTVASGMTLRIDIRRSCGPGPLGGIGCELSYRASGTSCLDGTSLLDLASPTGRGQHATREDLAATNAVQAFDRAGFVKTIVDRLNETLGLSCAPAAK